MTSRTLRLDVARRRLVTVVTATGRLDLSSYPGFRDDLLKTATDATDGLIVDITGLAIEDPSLASVFSLVAMRISDWPAIPFALVSGDPGHRELLKRRTIDRFVRVCPDIEVAEAGLGHPLRWRAERSFAPIPAASAHARSFVTETFERWGISELADDGRLVVTELVENVLRHTDSAPRARLDLRRDLFTIAVADDDPHPAVMRERLGATEPGMGLRLIAQVATAWGSSQSWKGGKVVWAVLTRRATTAGEDFGK